jgi:hypothetical protein
MAVETELRREPTAVESSALITHGRLHEEILPPRLKPSTPILIRNARRALAILAAGMILIQLISGPLGHRLNAVARSGTDAYSIWERYASNPVPEVLVIGNSLAQADFDEAALSAELSTLAGRSVTVEKLAFNGQGPLFYDALMYRIMKRSQHPKLVVVSTLAVDLNAGCPCLDLLTSDLWDITDLTDPGFVQLALGLDPDRSLLVAGWALPTVAYYPSIVAVQCLAVEYGRSSALSMLGAVPAQLQNPTICEIQPGHLLLEGWANSPAMTPFGMQRSATAYRQLMADYRISPDAVSSLRHVISQAQTGGVRVVLLESPVHMQARGLFPHEQQAYQQEVEAIASSLGARLVNLSDSVPEDPTLWVDTQHLDRAGAAYLAPKIANALAPALVG